MDREELERILYVFANVCVFASNSCAEFCAELSFTLKVVVVPLLMIGAAERSPNDDVSPPAPVVVVAVVAIDGREDRRDASDSSLLRSLPFSTGMIVISSFEEGCIRRLRTFRSSLKNNLMSSLLFFDLTMQDVIAIAH